MPIQTGRVNFCLIISIPHTKRQDLRVLACISSFLPMTEWDCFHHMNGPFIVVQHKIGRVNEVWSYRLSQTHMTRSRFTGQESTDLEH